MSRKSIKDRSKAGAEQHKSPFKQGSIEERIAAYLTEHPQEVEERRKCSLERLGYAFTEKKDRTFYGTTYIFADVLISPSWCIGGMTGGNCWGSSADQSLSADEEPTWLEDFMEQVFPKVSFLQFRRLQSKCIRLEYIEREYYGNYTEYAFKVLSVRDLLEVLNA